MSHTTKEPWKASLTSTLLLGEPIALPQGRRRMHHMDSGGTVSANSSRIAQAGERADNIERVYAAIVMGARTRIEVIDATGLSNRTVWKATNDLADWPGGARIVISKDGYRHLLSPVTVGQNKNYGVTHE